MNGEVLSGCEVVPYRDGWPPAPGFIVGFLLSPHGPKLLKTWVAVECSLLSTLAIGTHLDSHDVPAFLVFRELTTSTRPQTTSQPSLV